MSLIKQRPWWHFWPVVCWRHLRVVPRDDICPACALDIVRRFEEKMQAGTSPAPMILPPTPRKVYLLTIGEGEDGDPWSLLGVYATRDAAEWARVEYETPRLRPDGTSYTPLANEIEEWSVRT